MGCACSRRSTSNHEWWWPRYTRGSGMRAIRPTATGECGEESSLAWALREVDGLSVALFVTVNVLDLDPRGKPVFVAALEGYDRKSS